MNEIVNFATDNWWLIFPIMWFGFGFLSMFLRYRRQRQLDRARSGILAQRAAPMPALVEKPGPALGHAEAEVAGHVRHIRKGIDVIGRRQHRDQRCRRWWRQRGHQWRGGRGSHPRLPPP